MKTVSRTGITVNGGRISGRATVIQSSDDLDQMEDGDILVVHTSDPMYALGVFKASGLICEVGGRLSHICTVALEMGLPCLTQVKDATVLIKTGQWICLNADDKTIQLIEEC